jgi:hypothetical protein
MLIPQANLRISDSKEIWIERWSSVYNIQKYGNTTAAHTNCFNGSLGER